MGKVAKVPKVPKNIALDSSLQNSFSKSIQKIKKTVKVAPKKPINPERGLIYLSHLPHGFFEQQIQSYFKQFGRVTNVRLLRSHRTGRSKCAAFVEFLDPDVAKIAAETMDNYLMFKRRIEAKYINPEERHRSLFKVRISATKYPKKQLISAAREAKNRNITSEAHQKKVTKMLKKLQKKGVLDSIQVGHLDFAVDDIKVNKLDEVKVTPKKTKKVTNDEEKPKKTKTPVKASKVVKKEKAPTPKPASPPASPPKKLRKRPLKMEEPEDSEIDLSNLVKAVGIKTRSRSAKAAPTEVKKSLKTIQKKTKAAAKQPLVINPKIIESVTTRTKSLRKAKAILGIDSDIVTQVNLVAKKRGRKALAK